jgi:O-antigen ligase
MSATTLDRLRFALFVAGCVALFWQWDGAPTDWLFGAAILVSAAIWKGGLPAFDLDWPQTLLLLFLTITALATTLAGGLPVFFAITAYMAVLAMALSSTLKRNAARIRTIETAVIVAACVTSALIFAGGMVAHLNVPLLNILATDELRARGLFKDSNVAGVFVACSYPLAVAHCIGLRRQRAVFLVLFTAVFAIGVLFTYSRAAMGLFALGVVVAMVALAVTRERRLLVALGACVVLAGSVVGTAVAVDAFPLYRYQAVQSYDAGGRFVAWRVGVQMLLDSPLGTGAGTFERRAVETFEADLKRQGLADDGPGDSDNLARNGGFDGLVGWSYDPATTAVTRVDDPMSVTGHALRKETTAKYQDVSQGIPVVAGRTYSFAAQIRTDGTPALLIIHWRDGYETTIGQAGTEEVRSTSWTELQLLAQTAPPNAARAYLYLANRDAGEQLFTAIRMVEGTSVPPWSDAMQWGKFLKPEFGVISAHETYVRLAAESGLAGLLMLCAYWLALAWSGWRFGRASWHWPLAFTLVLLAGLVIDTLHWRQLWIYAAVIAAAFSHARAAQKIRPEVHAHARPIRPSV